MMRGAVLWLPLLALAGCVSTSSKTMTPSTSASAPTGSTNNVDAARINVQLGVGYLQQGNLPTAKDKLERALSQDPRNPDVHTALALLDQRLGNDKDADREFRKALDLSPNDPSLLNSYAVYLCARGRDSDGVKYFEQAAANPLYRTPWVAYTNAGVCLRAAKHEPDAQQRFARALQSNPSYSEAVYQLSDLERSQHQLATARLRIDGFLLSNGATPDLLLLGWQIAREQSDGEGQRRYAARLAKEFPTSEQARALANAPTTG